MTTAAAVDRQTLDAAVRAGRCGDVLHSFEPRPGDCVFIPAGTVHALGAGLVIAEIQQSSDVTYRLYDWDRVGADGDVDATRRASRWGRARRRTSPQHAVGRRPPRR